MSALNKTGQVPITEISRAAVYRKVAWRLLPFIMACYVAAFLDRVNVGFAKLTMLEDLGFSEAAYGMGAGLFFIGYFFFEVPSNLYMHKIGAKATISRIMVLWGLISAGFAFVQTTEQFYILRFLLGAAEAGFYPGIILLLTYWFPSERRAKVIAGFICAIPLAGFIGGPVSGMILDGFDETLGLAGWRWLFVIEAIPSLVLGVVAYFYLDNSPKSAKWLSRDEAGLIAADLKANESRKASYASHSFKDLFKNKWIVLITTIVFCQALGQYALSFWIPTLIGQTGVKGVLNIGFISAIPYAFAIAAILLVSRSSDRRLERRWHLIVPFLVGGIGLSLSALLGQHTIVALAAICVAAAGCYSVTALVWNIPPAFTSGAGAAGGIALINSIGALAGFVSPYAIGWIKTETGSTDLALHLLALSLALGAVLTWFLPSKRVNV